MSLLAIQILPENVSPTMTREREGKCIKSNFQTEYVVHVKKQSLHLTSKDSLSSFTSLSGLDGNSLFEIKPPPPTTPIVTFQSSHKTWLISFSKFCGQVNSTIFRMGALQKRCCLYHQNTWRPLPRDASLTWHELKLCYEKQLARRKRKDNCVALCSYGSNNRRVSETENCAKLASVQRLPMCVRIHFSHLCHFHHLLGSAVGLVSFPAPREERLPPGGPRSPHWSLRHELKQTRKILSISKKLV